MSGVNVCVVLSVSVVVVDWLTSDCVSLHWVPVSSLTLYSRHSLEASVCHSLPPPALFLSKCVRLCVCM